MTLPKSFYRRETKEVAKDLLGKILVSKKEGITSGKIVETESYYGPEDPASRASNGKTKISKPMWSEPGTILVYVVHAHHLFNIVTEERGKPRAVLIRALEPLEGIELMKQRRGTNNVYRLCRGPGCLTQALGITREDNEKDVTDPNNDIIIRKGKPEKLEVGSSHRIGVTEDLEEELRFFIKDNKFLSN